MSSKMTACPKPAQKPNVSNAAKPVTQVALVAVKRASIKGVHPCPREDMGRESKNVPIDIMAKKLKATVPAGDIFNFESFFFNILSLIIQRGKIKSNCKSARLSLCFAL